MTTEVAATTIVYPETDGMPLPDGETQSPIFVAIQECSQASSAKYAAQG